MVSQLEDPELNLSSPVAFAPDEVALSELIETRPEIKVDGEKPTLEQLADRLSEFWLPNEPILYIGLAGTSVAGRVDQYYKTRIGARTPHAGGWFLKMTSLLPDLFVHFGESEAPGVSEETLLRSFVDGLGYGAVERLRDPAHPMPFANLEFPKGVRKRHGITGAKAPRNSPERRTTPKTTERGNSARTQSLSANLRTQRVTEADLRGGRVRIPRGEPKQAFPAEKCQVRIQLKGVAFDCRWDPRYGPPERSGVLSVGKAELNERVSAEEVLTIEVDQGQIHLS
jgi:hypothetical protein